MQTQQQIGPILLYLRECGHKTSDPWRAYPPLISDEDIKFSKYQCGTVYVKRKRSFWQWVWRCDGMMKFYIRINTKGNVDIFIAGLNGIVMWKHGETIDLSHPNALKHLETTLKRTQIVDSPIHKMWGRFLFEAHAPDCMCSYCSKSLWPFLWLPKDKKPNSWRIIAMWFGGRRVYLRWTNSR